MDHTQLALEIAKLLVTTIASGVAAYFGIRIALSQRDIAKQQARTAAAQREIAQAKLQLDLFDRRYAMFEEVWEFLSRATSANVAEPPETWPELTNSIPKSRFLFGPEVESYMQLIHRKRLELDALHAQIRAQGCVVMSQEQSAQLTDLQLWFFDEASQCSKRFARYLDFGEWRNTGPVP